MVKERHNDINTLRRGFFPGKQFIEVSEKLEVSRCIRRIEFTEPILRHQLEVHLMKLCCQRDSTGLNDR